MTTSSNPKRIQFNRADKDYSAYYDDQLIGIFATYTQAEIALDDYALDLLEQGLVDEVSITTADWQAPRDELPAGHRLADETEAGWYFPLASGKVWITDAPATITPSCQIDDPCLPEEPCPAHRAEAAAYLAARIADEPELVEVKRGHVEIALKGLYEQIIPITSESTVELFERSTHFFDYQALLIDGHHYDLCMTKHLSGRPELAERCQEALETVQNAIAALALSSAPLASDNTLHCEGCQTEKPESAFTQALGEEVLVCDACIAIDEANGFTDCDLLDASGATEIDPSSDTSPDLAVQQAGADDVASPPASDLTPDEQVAVKRAWARTRAKIAERLATPACSKCGEPADPRATLADQPYCLTCGTTAAERLLDEISYTGPRCPDCGDRVAQPGRCPACQDDAGPVPATAPVAPNMLRRRAQALLSDWKDSGVETEMDAALAQLDRALHPPTVQVCAVCGTVMHRTTQCPEIAVEWLRQRAVEPTGGMYYRMYREDRAGLVELLRSADLEKAAYALAVFLTSRTGVEVTPALVQQHLARLVGRETAAPAQG
jgi:hypothetical protein